MLEKPIRALFASPLTAAAFLILNGLVLFTAERLRRREKPRVGAHSAPGPGSPGPRSDGSAADGPGSDARIATTLSWKEALGIGAAQAAALVP
ncbi:MAG TPA: undecaprenyl-diphosphatase, partial [Arthrobacter bacterium]|nr:undecaprenyl-diphosphatase [Arthrobacter sp.]